MGGRVGHLRVQEEAQGSESGGPVLGWDWEVALGVGAGGAGGAGLGRGGRALGGPAISFHHSTGSSVQPSAAQPHLRAPTLPPLHPFPASLARPIGNRAKRDGIMDYPALPIHFRSPKSHPNSGEPAQFLGGRKGE